MTRDEKQNYILKHFTITIDGKIFNEKGREVGKGKDKDGYLQYCYGGSNFRVHRLIAIKFKYIDDYENMDCHHIDGNIYNNSADNLEFIYRSNHSRLTREENDQYGENNPNAKLTWDDIRYIRAHYVKGKNNDALREKFSIKKSMFNYIVSGKYWKE